MDRRAPPDLTPPDGVRPPGLPADHAVKVPRRHTWVWVLLGLLTLAAFAVVFALPGLLTPAPEELVPPEPVAVDSGPADSRPQAQQTLEQYLRLRAKLELENAAAWGQSAWVESAQHATDGDQLFAQKRFGAAAQEYARALQQLQELESSRAPLLETALAEGAAALAADDVPAALGSYQKALQIVPEHEGASDGIASAKRRAAVLEQMKLGREAEASDDLEAARTAYKEAVGLDSAYLPAATALQQVDGELAARGYRKEMTRALQALDAGNIAEAEKALAEAGRLRPGDPAVRDARQRLQSMRVRRGLDKLRRQVESRIRNEDWQAAVRLYRKALDIDSSAGFARSGMQHAEQRAKLHAQIDHYLKAPARLYVAQPLANAGKLLESVGNAPSTEPVLQKKIGRLRLMVEEARVPIRVTLTSDGETEVAVYRVARLGRFMRHDLDLRPGDYTVVGSRAGYRDVRKVIRVRPGKPVSSLSIRCEETI